MSMKQSATFGIATALLLGSSTLAAQDTPVTESDTRDRGFGHDAHPSFYVGAGYGGFRARGGEFDDNNDFLELKVGGFFTPHLAVEGSATFFGSYGGDVASADVKGYGVSLIGRLPMSETWGIYAKGGLFFWDTDIDTAVGSYDADGNDPFFGVGTDFRLTPNLNLIAEYNRYAIDTRVEDLPGVDDTDLDTLQVGIRWHF